MSRDSTVAILKNLLSLLGVLLPVVEKYFNLLPVNPLVRDDVFPVSIVASAIAGLGGYQSTRNLKSCRFLGWIGVLLFVLFLMGELAITSAEITFGLSPRVVSLSVRVGYVLIFLSLGLAIGGFLGLHSSSPVSNHPANEP